MYDKGQLSYTKVEYDKIRNEYIEYRKRAYEKYGIDADKIKQLKLEFARLKNWANDEDETDGYDISDFIDHINSVVKTVLEGR